MAKERFPHFNEIPWDKIKEVRVSKDKEAYSFEFDIEGRRRRMLISILPDQTAFTLSMEDGTPLMHAVQSNGEIKLFDMSKK